MKKYKLAFLVLLIFSLALFLSGCGLFSTNQSPNANFSANPKSGNAPLEVNFDASGSSDPDGNIASYNWNFGDGSTDSGQTVTHTYDSSGNYTVELTVTDDDGASDTITYSIEVSPPPNNPPTASFTASPTSGEAPLEVSFDASGSSDPDGTIDSYSWDFGDGSTGNGETVNHTFSSAGDYMVELTVMDNGGASETTTESISVSVTPNQSPTASFDTDTTSGEAPLEVTFDASSSIDSDGNITSYNWDFDDGATGSAVSAIHTFDSSGSYNVELTVTDNDGATDSKSRTISVTQPNQPPTASFTANPTSGEAPLEVSFDASGSSDPDGSIDSYNWDFGDGATGNGETTSNPYSSSGNYTVQLTVEDNGGVTDSMTMNVSVSAPSNESPDASFSANPSSGTSPLDVSFDASNSNDPDGSIASYEWDFDDGSSGTGITIDHTFENPDDPIDSRFNVELTVIDDDGASNTATETITVSSPENQPPNASFTATPNSGEAALKVEFDASGSSDSDGTIDSYSWDFGDGSTGNGETVNHTFNTAGDYKVTLEVRDDDLATDSTTKTISVSAPNYNFLAIGEPYEAPDGLTVTLNSLDVTEKSGSYEYSINYTLENNTEDQKIAEGTFKMYYKNKTGGEPQYGFFDELFPGDSVNRTYTFEELKSDPYGILEYHHDHFFADNPLPDSLKWQVTLP